MADVFLSYSSQERESASQIAALLEKHGYSVWWDTALVAGDVFQRQTAEQLDAAKGVIVIWSPSSVKSNWVYAEASRGMRANKLITLRSPNLDVSDIPVPFNTLHTVPLADGTAILAGLARLIGERKSKANESMGKSDTETAPTEGQTAHEDLDIEAATDDREHYDVFVAYSRKDKQACEDLIVRLRGQELDVFYDQFLRGGDRWRGVIARTIRRSAVFIVLLSKDSLSSPEVEKELNMAVSVNANLIPVRLDDAPLSALLNFEWVMRHEG